MCVEVARQKKKKKKNEKFVIPNRIEKGNSGKLRSKDGLRIKPNRIPRTEICKRGDLKIDWFLMSRICELSDDLLVNILLFLHTKDVVATSLLSKRWLSLWKLVPKLEYCYSTEVPSSDFIDNFLRLTKAPLLDTLHLRLGLNCTSEEQERWVTIAAARHVRVLDLRYYRCRKYPMPCPRSLFTCKSLVVLRLQEVAISDIPSTMLFQSLKTLCFLFVKFCSGDELVHRFLSACPLLETLVVYRWLHDMVRIFTIAVPSLQSLCIMPRLDGHLSKEDCHYVINTPCLKTLNFFDKFSRVHSLVKMPNLVKAEIKIRQEDSKVLMGCLTSAKHLSLCLSSAKHLSLCLTSDVPLLMPKPGAFFCHLEYLELCTKWSSDWLCLLLRHSPKLRVLRLKPI